MQTTSLIFTVPFSYCPEGHSENCNSRLQRYKGTRKLWPDWCCGSVKAPLLNLTPFKLFSRKVILQQLPGLVYETSCYQPAEVAVKFGFKLELLTTIIYSEHKWKKCSSEPDSSVFLIIFFPNVHTLVIYCLQCVRHVVHLVTPTHTTFDVLI